MKKEQIKNIQYKKILAIINSCRNIIHIENCKIILTNFFRLHGDVTLHSNLRRELNFKRLSLI